MEQQGSLIGRLPLAPFSRRNWRENAGSVMPRPPHMTEPRARGTRGQHPPLPGLLAEQTQECCSPCSPCFPRKRSYWAVPLIPCVCLWVSELQGKDRAALRSGSVQAGFVNGPFVFRRCACKRGVKLNSSKKPTTPDVQAYIPVNYTLASSIHRGKLWVEGKEKGVRYSRSMFQPVTLFISYAECMLG